MNTTTTAGVYATGALGNAAAEPAYASYIRQLASHNYPVYTYRSGMYEPTSAGTDGTLPESAGTELYTFCPVHENSGGHEPDLTLTLTGDGRVLTYCFPCQGSSYAAVASGEIAECTAFLEMHEHAGGGGGGSYVLSWPGEKKARKQVGGRLMSCLDVRPWDESSYTEFGFQQVVASEDDRYYAETAVYFYGPNFAKVRWETGGGAKTFRWYRRVGGNWTRKLGLTMPPFFGADDLGRGGAVLCVEGEKDVLRARELGFDAVSTQWVSDGYFETGTGRYLSHKGVTWEWMRGRDLVVIPDNDDAGISYRDEFAARARTRGGWNSLLVMEPLPGVAAKGDLSEWADADGTRERLLKLIEAAGAHAEAAPDPAEGCAPGQPLKKVMCGGVCEACTTALMKDFTPRLDECLAPRMIPDPDWEPPMPDEGDGEFDPDAWYDAQMRLKSNKERAKNTLLDRITRMRIDDLMSAGKDDGTWAELDLEELLDGPAADEPSLLSLSDDAGVSLLYPKAHWTWGPSGAGKSILHRLEAAQVMAGALGERRHVIWVDLEFQARLHVQELMRMHGLDRETVAKYFHVVTPGGWSEKGYRALLEKHTAGGGIGLEVVDACNGLVTLFGKDPNDDTAIYELEKKIINPAVDAGAGVRVIDHVTKSWDGREWPKNSGRKRDAAWTGVAVVKMAPFSREQDGYSKLTFWKDRSGYHTDGQTAAYLVMQDGVPRLTRDVPAALLCAVTDAATAAATDAKAGDDDKRRMERAQAIRIVVEEDEHTSAAGVGRAVQDKYGDALGGERTLRQTVTRMLADSELNRDGKIIRLAAPC